MAQIGSFVPAEAAEIGLVAFGHTKAADCRDVETLIPVAPLVVGEMIGQLDRMEPRGRAPLSAAIRAAAEALPRDRTRGNIVVVTDGPDTCAPDPCALTDTLATLPVDVTVQIVGLAPEAGGPELACFAEATGGRIEVVDTASSLASALRAAVVAPPTVVIRPVTAGGASIPADRRFAWSVIEDASGRRVVDGRDAAVLRTSLPPGRYQVQAAGQVGSGRIAIEVGENDVRARLTLSDDVRVVPPPTAEIGAEIDVAWRGPDGPGDYLAIAEPGAPVTGFLTYARVSAGNPVTIAVPGAPGRFEVRYVDAAGNRILASAPIEVIAPDASLVAPTIVEALSDFTVAWTGPGAPGDRLSVAPQGSDPGAGEMTPLGDSAETRLRAPRRAGIYDIRYLSASGAILADRPVRVMLSARLEAPPSAVAGDVVRVEWEGPDDLTDFVTIVAEDAPDATRGGFEFTRLGSPLEIVTGSAPGRAEVRYVSGETNAVLARLPIMLTKPEVTLDAPESAIAGSVIRVRWEGPDKRNDAITVVPADAPDDARGTVVYTARGTPSQVATPPEPGRAEIRYLAGGDVVLARRPILLTRPETVLDAAPVVTAGAKVTINWSGPDNRNDFITIVPAGTPDNMRLNYTFTRRGSPLDVIAPPSAGQAEIRYVEGQTSEVLARLPVVLREAEVSLSAPVEVVAGSTVEVRWTGPNNPNDYLTVVPADAPEDARGNFNFTWRGNPLALLTPEQTGPAEIRYRSGQTGEVLARRPIELTRVVVSLSAPETAVAGDHVMVTWVGPGGANDYVSIVEDGAADDVQIDFNFTRRGNPLRVATPPLTGPAEIRYHDGDSRRVLARLPLVLTEPEVTVEAVDTVVAGAPVSVRWAGPDDTNDFVTIVPVGTPDNKRGAFVYTRNGNPLEVLAPAKPGAAEIRYRSGVTGEVLARRPLALTRPEVTLEAQPIAPAGASIPVTWEGPNNPNDFITIVPAGAPDDRRAEYNYTRRGNPLPVRTPPRSGRA
ncbi:MAG: hypothetical protein AAFZ09_02255, partial [Pseudomonadota bacterium]